MCDKWVSPDSENYIIESSDNTKHTAGRGGSVRGVAGTRWVRWHGRWIDWLPNIISFSTAVALLLETLPVSLEHHWIFQLLKILTKGSECLIVKGRMNHCEYIVNIISLVWSCTCHCYCYKKRRDSKSCNCQCLFSVEKLTWTDCDKWAKNLLYPPLRNHSVTYQYVTVSVASACSPLLHSTWPKVNRPRFRVTTKVIRWRNLWRIFERSGSFIIHPLH